MNPIETIRDALKTGQESVPFPIIFLPALAALAQLEAALQPATDEERKEIVSQITAEWVDGMGQDPSISIFRAAERRMREKAGLQPDPKSGGKTVAILGQNEAKSG